MSKKSNLQEAIAELNKLHGENFITTGSAVGEVKSLTSGSLLLDGALGVGGYPIGRCIELFGKPSAGKTLLCLTAMKEVQLSGGTAVYLDLEHGYDKNFAHMLGVNVENLVISQPEYLEQGLQILLRLIEVSDLIVFDSVAGCPTKKELEEPLTKDDMGIRAKKMTRAMTQIAAKASNHNCTIMFINQFRESLSMYEGPKSPGGNALKHHCSIRLKVQEGAKMEKDGEYSGYHIKIKVIKNKVAPPNKEVNIPVLVDKGISRELEIIDLAMWNNLIKKSGSWYSYNDIKLGQGINKAVMFLEDNTELYQEIINKIDLP